MGAAAILPRLAARLRHGWIAVAAALLASVWSLAGATARELTAAEKAELGVSVERFHAAMKALDTDKVVAVLPPRFIADLAGRANVAPEALRAEIGRLMAETMKAVTIHSFGMDLPAAREQQLADGTPYMLIPTAMVMEVASRKLETKSNTLAMMDGGTWYLLDLGDPSKVTLFTRVYPEFAGVEFGGTTTKAVP